jgi:hypothetical protein
VRRAKLHFGDFCGIFQKTGREPAGEAKFADDFVVP